MKQFPKVAGKQVDQSAYLEFQVHELIQKQTEPFGKFAQRVSS